MIGKVMLAVLFLGTLAIAAPVPNTTEPEPEWMAAFRAKYELKEGEYVKRVASPFIKERVEFELDAFTPAKNLKADAINRKSYEKYENWLTLVIDQDGRKLVRRRTISSVGLTLKPGAQRGDKLFEVSQAISLITDYEPPEYKIDGRFKNDPLFAKGNLTVNGDWIVRKDAPMEKLAPQLEAILRNECKVGITLKVEMVEQDVFVVGGSFKLKPPEWREKKVRDRTVLDIYASEEWLNKNFDHFDQEKMHDPSGIVASLQYSGTPTGYIRFLGDRIKTRIVWDQPLPVEPKFSWNNHLLINPTAQEELDDHDPEKVLKHATEQTGLTFKKEKRKVPVLVLIPKD